MNIESGRKALIGLMLVVAGSLAAVGIASAKPGKGGGGSGGGSDSTAPATIQQIAVDVIGNAATLYWVTPGDDGWEGQAARYDIRYSMAPITEANFPAAFRAERSEQYVPLPAGVAAAGESTPCEMWDGTTPSQFCDYFVVRNLESETFYYFAVKVLDDAGNVSGMATASGTTTSTPFSIDTLDVSDTDPFRDIQLAKSSHGSLAVSHLVRGSDLAATDPGGQLEIDRGLANETEVVGLGEWFGNAYYTGPLLSLSDSGDRLGTVVSGQLPRSKGKSLWGHVYVDEDAGGNWRGNLVVSGQNDFELYGSETDVTLNDHGEPVIPYVYKYRHELWIAERTGPDWDKTIIVDCGDQAAAFTRGKVGTTADGRLWVLARLIPEGNLIPGQWLIAAVRARDGQGWQYYTTGAVTRVTFDHWLAFDSEGSPYIAAAVDRSLPSDLEQYQIDLALFSGPGIRSTTTPCQAPAEALAGIDYEVVDSVLAGGETFVDGPSLDTQAWGFVRGLWMFPVSDTSGSVVGHDIHIASVRDNGNYYQAETRILSRCSGAPAWIRDPIDRSHEPGASVLVDRSSVSSAYAWRRAARPGTYGQAYDPTPTMSLYLANREGNACGR